MQTEVSIILPIHNAEEFLAEALQSILDQTHQNFELIAGDDGSTDGSRDILAHFARRDKRIVTSRWANRGVGVTVNECLQRAKNDLVARFDADDVMLPVRLERQICFMQKHPELSVATSYAWLIDRQGKILAKAKPAVDIERGIRERNPSYFVELITPSTIMRKADVQAVGGYPNGYRLGDRELWGRLVAAGYRLGVQPEFLLKQRLHRSSITANRIREGLIAGKLIDHNIVCLLQGQTCLSLETFLERRRAMPPFKRLLEALDELSAVHYRNATRDFAERDWWRFATHSTAASCLNPLSGFRMLRRVARRRNPIGPSSRLGNVSAE
jgi:glycosyltransferase involved in cell wall biosynthesis